MMSINTRLLLAGSVVLAAFLGLTGMTLDNVFRDSAREAVKQRLQAHTYALIAAADIDDDGSIHMPRSLPEARFSIPDSGLYARIASNSARHTWRSPSMTDTRIPFATGLSSASQHFSRLATPGGAEVFALSFGITWDESNNAAAGYTFSVAETLDGYHAQVSGFRRSLWGWLGAVAVVLLAAQGTILRWGLAPLRRAARELENIESGGQRELQGSYPRELRGLTDNLNALLHNQREHLDRYRHTLDDLAHSLKTPLAILRGTANEPATEQTRRTVEQQVERMAQIVGYQLQRAATSGRTVLTAPVSIQDTAAKVVASLDKVYADKQVASKLDIAADAVFHGDEGDLMEILGNLLDNAYKWCHHRVNISAHTVRRHSAQPAELIIRIEDDGPGISAASAEKLLQRGVRGDTATEGQGIGLAVVQDIVQVYQGSMNLDSGAAGGARITIHLPGD